MGLFRSIVNLRRWRGAKPNALQAGRVDVSVEAVASGQIGIRSVQRGYAAVNLPGSGTFTITLGTALVDYRKAIVLRHGHSGWLANSTALATGPTTVTVTNYSGYSIGSGNGASEWEVVEFF